MQTNVTTAKINNAVPILMICLFYTSFIIYITQCQAYGKPYNACTIQDERTVYLLENPANDNTSKNQLS